MPTKARRPRYVLIIEDNVHHAELLTEVLDRHFSPVVIHTVDTIEDGIEFASQSNYDLILADGVVRDAPITEAISKLSTAPVIVITGRGDERLAAEAIKKGAVEYLVKTRETLENLPPILEKHLKARRPTNRRKAPSFKKERESATPSAASIIEEVDRLTQQALAIAGPRRRKGGGVIPSDIEQLDRLLNQIKRLRDMASKLIPE